MGRYTGPGEAVAPTMKRGRLGAHPLEAMVRMNPERSRGGKE